jgi:iron-sulfur cluster biosynthesis transcriptional regulator SufR
MFHFPSPVFCGIITHRLHKAGSPQRGRKTVNYEMQETRGKILQLLKMRANMTANELADALDISSMGVRQHLAILEGEALVEHQREKQQRGRPTHLYHLTEKAHNLFPKTYASFAVNLLHEVEKFNGAGFINRVFRSRMKSQTETYKERLDGKNLDERVKELAQMRSEEGYMAEVVEEADAYVLIEHNCPIATIAEEYPHVCNTELALFRQSLGAKLIREDHLIDGCHRCSYRIPKDAGDD